MKTVCARRLSECSPNDMQIKKNRKTPLQPAAETRQSVEERFAWATGAPGPEWMPQRDPLYQVTENFQQSFDRIGKSHAAAAAAGFAEGTEKSSSEEQDLLDKGDKQEPKGNERKPSPQGTRGKATGNDAGKERKAETSPLTRFSDIAFRRGAMSASVLNGTGKMMLVSCMRRTAYETGPKHLQQQTLAGTGSVTRAIPGHVPDQIVFNRGFTNSALGIVVDTLRDARRVVETMTAIVQGAGEGTGPTRAALYKLYPFLDDSRDAEMEAEYRAKLEACTDEREKPLLQNALVRAVSLRAKKAQMKNEFINKLRFISDRATETLSELETAGIEEELTALAFGEEADDLPENPDEGADGDAPNRNKNGAGETAGEGDAAEGDGQRP